MSPLESILLVLLVLPFAALLLLANLEAIERWLGRADLSLPGLLTTVLVLSDEARRKVGARR